MNHSRRFAVGAAVLALMLAGSVVRAQTPKIYLDVDDVAAEPGQTITIPVFIENLPDSIIAYQLGVTMSRPDIGFFVPDVDQTGTLTEGWSKSVSHVGDYDEKITSVSGFEPDWIPIPPNTSGVLVKLEVTLYCDIPDTMQDRTVNLNISPINSFFADPSSNLIMPLDLTPGSVTAALQCPHQGDIEPDGFETAVDLSAIIGILYEGDENVKDLCCPTNRFDLDCDGFVTSLDLSVMIDHLYSGGPGPCTPVNVP